jgi:hypothetical protein
MKRSRINPISPKKRIQIAKEKSIRPKLCERAGGTWLTNEWGQEYCVGFCEWEHPTEGWRCNKWGVLHPHEKLFRGKGGELSMENSIMCCIYCQGKDHGERVVESHPRWYK